MYIFLYKSVYPLLAKHMEFTVEETDKLMKARFLSLGRVSVEKKHLTREQLHEYIQLVMAYALSVGCDISEFLERNKYESDHH